MIELKDVSLGYGKKTVLSGLTLTLPERGVVAVTGPSGCGKTTLMRLFAGLIAPMAGHAAGLEGLRASVVFQEDRLLNWLTAAENVALVNDGGDAIACLEAMELKEQANALPTALSGGMQRRVALARAMNYGGDMLALDEPFKGLDGPLRLRVAKKLASAFPLILIATHDVEEARLMGKTEVIRLG